MILSGKKIIIMGIRNEYSIAWGAANSAKEQGAEVIFVCNTRENEEKIFKITSQISNVRPYTCDVSSDESIEECFKKILRENGKVDGIVHSIAHAHSADLKNDFILTSREGYLHACDVSAYSLVIIARIAKELNLLNENSSIVSYTYYGSEKVVDGYNVMGVAKASLEANIRYLAKDLGKYNIRINGISAGPIKTLSARGIKNFSDISSIVEEKSALHRNITLKQIGDVTGFLLSDLSSAVTGEIMHVDNGFSIICL